MKRQLTSLIIILAAAGCGKTTGMASRDIESPSITVRLEGPAQIEGPLSEDVCMKNLISMLPATGVTEIRLRCPESDTADIRKIADALQIPVYIDAGPEGTVPKLCLQQEGLRWEPRYSWSSTEGSSCMVEGLVILSNSSGQQWDSTTVKLEDAFGNPVATTSAGFSIPEGDMVIRWWEATGTAGMMCVVYGWPNTGRWNAVRPLVVSSSGSITDFRQGEGIWPGSAGDTIWTSVENMFDIREEMMQCSTGYLCSVTITNISNEFANFRVLYPKMLPRGALMQPEEEFRELISIDPGKSRSIEYSIIYPEG